MVDIGCNDGTLLDGYTAPNISHLGYDPSDVSRYAVEKGYDVVNDFFSAGPFIERHADRKAKVVTSIAMFYDLEHPRDFVADVAAVLAQRGVWVMELHYLPLMLEMNSFDAIVHEHLEYYSLAVLERLFAEEGLEVVHAELNDINGGSIRLFIGHAGKLERTARAERARSRPCASASSSWRSTLPSPTRLSGATRSRSATSCSRLLHDLKAEGKTVHVYGASTKGNTILQYAGIDSSLVSHAADRNPDKWGSETIATRIPIISEEDSRAMKPDYYLALPWHFLDEFLERETEFLERGGRFIVPLPDVRIVPE